MKHYITYLRVSTKKQGNSGLGLEAQQTVVQNFTKDGTVIAEYVEVESGKKADRPQLLAAIEHCKRTGATLVVAKLDRLARNVEFTASLMRSGVQFVACDCPTANNLTIHILAAVAEEEARAISERTKRALAEAKRKGTRLGAQNPNTLAALRKTAGRYQRQPTDYKAKYPDVYPVVKTLREIGHNIDQIAEHLKHTGLSRSTLYAISCA